MTGRDPDVTTGSVESAPAAQRGRPRVVAHHVAQLCRFVWIELQCCAFAIVVLAGIAASTLLRGYWDAPILRYDALLVFLVAVQVMFVASRLETPRELLVVCIFHILGLVLEIFKVAAGSWEYPESGIATVAGVPLYAGFMYAAVGSYICQAFRRFDLGLGNYRIAVVGTLAMLAYVNFFTHHLIGDFRFPLLVAFLLATIRMRVWFTVGDDRYWMPLPLSFVLIGLFLWIAENIATYFGAWQYPGQEAGWQLVHIGKFSSWTLLVTLSFVLVTALIPRRPDDQHR
ncbi:DUF817 domain-containing protein [Gordonia sp. (in: high G+C Gram-positive bacteria)]|uniref:DUF817 domain-containing protein n=1 Tax=Gordonia sp. (in: high G+C Gram-positive bacteria) TaxID=84139 RepID=UPI001D5B01F8|nr:DUF817 domain-containing protein [Gordonia sp. (in: high G+C Gram-positive bacteria)]MCB1294575.1 DUF817 domain-containing protein [Gordonia sp. (in: high G+C Gram-positive bacteria)]HMS75687.1 DUF817 domain-containing protein [Gordonia sp. (in: high G+C Gram-positive bacteria)]HQV17874.1 DUF817 domain-containing protein [Gordonia sp. (in: high G+C Gram-positive bacteria)]